MKQRHFFALALLWLCCAALMAQHPLRRVQLIPDVEMNEVQVLLTVHVEKAGKYDVELVRSAYADEEGEEVRFAERHTLGRGENQLEMLIDMGENPHLWSEFHPDLYTLTATLRGKGVTDQVRHTFAMRSIASDDTRLFVNGNPVFLRSVHDGCCYPDLSADSLAAWRQFFARLRQCGLNHYRFHLHAPTEAAFVAADEVGVYLSAAPSVSDPESTLSDPALHLPPSMLDAPDSICAWSLDCCKEGLERALRTQRGGYQFCALSDTAVAASPQNALQTLSDTLRALNAPVLPLAAVEACDSDTLRIALYISNYTEEDHHHPLSWHLYSIGTDGRPTDALDTHGALDYIDAWQGCVTRVGEIHVPLALSHHAALPRMKLYMWTGEYVNNETIDAEVQNNE